MTKMYFASQIALFSRDILQKIKENMLLFFYIVQSCMQIVLDFHAPLPNGI